MSPETLTDPTVETESQPVPLDQLIELCRESKLPISVEQLAWLIPNIETRDLKEHPVGKGFGVEPLAIATREGILLDLRYEKLRPEQQQYVLGHELGHFLSSYLRQTDEVRWAQLNEMAQSLPDDEVSNYIGFLNESLKDEPSVEKIAEEKLAELITQYLNGGGTFAGMMASKMIHLPDFERTPENYGQLEQEAVELEGLLASAHDGETALGLLQQYPKLQTHFTAWQMISKTFANSETYQPLEDILTSDEQWEGYLDSDWLDYPELAEQFEPLSSSRPIPQKASSGQQVEKTLFDFLKFWKIFD